MAFLIDGTGERHSLSPMPVTIGRAPDNDISLNNDSVSTYHARLERQGHNLLLTDLNSSNGTYVNRQRIMGAQKLSPGDTIHVGQVMFRYQAERAAQAAGKFCPSCGTSARPGAKFCGSCGSPLKASPPQVPPSPPPAMPPRSPAGSSQDDETTVLPSSYQDPVPPSPQPNPGYRPQPAYKSPQPVYKPPQPPAASPPSYAQARPAGKRSLNLTEALAFPFSGNNGLIKMIIGAAMWLVPLVGLFFNFGFFVDAVRRVSRDDPNPMPEWDDWGTKLTEGIAAFTLGLIWLTVIIFVFSLFPIFLAVIGEEEVGFLLGYAIGYLAVMVLYFFLPVIIGRYATQRRFAAGLEVGQIFGTIRRHFGRYLGNWLLAGLLMTVGMIITGTIFGLGIITVIGLICAIPFVFVYQFYWNLFQSHLLAQLYRKVK